MIKILCVICLLAFCSSPTVDESLWLVIDFWLTDDESADFNMDGIVNFKDFALIGSYGSDEYGIDNYGN